MDISRIEMVLLGMIAARPSYAYEIDQYIKERNMRRWVRIGSASVYQGLERLAVKGLAACREEREGKMPPRRRYRITEKGSEALREGVRNLLSRCEDHYVDLNLGLFCCHILPPGQMPGLIEERLARIPSRMREIKVYGRLVKKEHLWQQQAILTILREFCRAEKKALKEISVKLHEILGMNA